MEEAVKVLVPCLLSGKEIRIAIQKDGKLAAVSWELLRVCFEAAGIEIPQRPENKRIVLSPKGHKNIRIGLFGHETVFRLVTEYGVDFGIVGEDKAIEMGVQELIAARLGEAGSSFMIQVQKNSGITSLEQLNGKIIATSFPAILRKYLESKNIKPEKIKFMSGGVEGAPAFGVAEITADLVVKGEGMRDNSLEPLETIRNFEAVLIRKPDKPMLQKPSAILPPRVVSTY